MGIAEKKRRKKDNRLIMLYKGLWMKPEYPQMTLFPNKRRIGLHRIIGTVLNRNRQVYFMLRLTAHFTTI